jgi:hypothetical protein
LPPALPAELTTLIKSADRAAAYLEATRLAGFAEAEAKRFFGAPPEVPASLEREYLASWSIRDAEMRYLKRFADSIKSE